MIVSGTAGTGKSFLIHCLKALLLDGLRVMAPTGVAAFNVGSVTLHSHICQHVESSRHWKVRSFSNSSKVLVEWDCCASPCSSADCCRLEQSSIHSSLAWLCWPCSPLSSSQTHLDPVDAVAATVTDIDHPPEMEGCCLTEGSQQRPQHKCHIQL